VTWLAYKPRLKQMFLVNKVSFHSCWDVTTQLTTNKTLLPGSFLTSAQRSHFVSKVRRSVKWRRIQLGGNKKKKEKNLLAGELVDTSAKVAFFVEGERRSFIVWLFR